MNFWGFTSDLFEHLEKHFIEFLKAHGTEMKSESYIPTLIEIDDARSQLNESWKEIFVV